MATRFYFPSTGTSPLSGYAVSSSWDVNNVSRLPLNRTKGSSAFVERTVVDDVTTNQWDVCVEQFVSEPLAAQTLSGTVKAVARVRESAAGANARSQIIVRIVSNDGSVVRGTFGFDSGTTVIDEWFNTTSSTSSSSRVFPTAGSATISSTSVQAGDRLVVEIGARCHNTNATSFTMGIWLGEASATDLDFTGSITFQNNPWVEFSQDITFQSSGITPATATGSGTLPKFSATTTATATANGNVAATSSITAPALFARTRLAITASTRSVTAGIILPDYDISIQAKVPRPSFGPSVIELPTYHINAVATRQPAG